MNALDVDIERWLALLYEGKGSAAREQALRDLNTNVDAHAFAAALKRSWNDERAVPAVAAVVDDWSQRHSHQQRQSLHQVATPLILALRQHLGAALLRLGSGDFDDRGAFRSICFLFAAVVDDSYVAAQAALEAMAASEPHDAGDRAAAYRRIYFSAPR